MKRILPVLLLVCLVFISCDLFGSNDIENITSSSNSPETEEQDDGTSVEAGTDVTIRYYYAACGIDEIQTTDFPQGTESFEVDGSILNEIRNKGCTIKGFYADSECKTSQLFNDDGTIVSGSVRDYVTDGKWNCTKEEVSIYAKITT